MSLSAERLAHAVDDVGPGVPPAVMVRVEAQKLKIEMLSAISKRGKLRFMLYKDSMNSEKLIDFMTRLITDSKKKVFLVPI